jgi:iron-sulfur cluster repair protein YtfE (RIC family)
MEIETTDPSGKPAQTQVQAETVVRFLDDHARLRGKSEVLDALALRVLRGDEDLGTALRLKGEEIQEHLIAHMVWEEGKLLPLLQSVDSGQSAAAQLLSDHVAQRERLADCLRALTAAERRPAKLAKTILDLTAWLEHDMLAEERRILAILGHPARCEPGAH